MSKSFKVGPIAYDVVKITPSGVKSVIGQQGAFSEELAVPATIKRPKPADLFLNRTQRTVQLTRLTTDFGSWKDTLGNTYVGPLTAILSPGDDGQLNGYPAIETLDGRLRHKIKSQNVNLAQSLAEYRQTSKMFSNLAIDVTTTFRSLRSGRALQEFVKILRDPKTRPDKRIANRWLEYQYGVRPLMQDVYGSAEALATKIRTGMYLHANTRVEESFESASQLAGGFNQKVFLRRKYTWVGIARARYRISDPTIKQLAQLGISNPLLLAWELIPYSFVIDWLFPVGKWLESLDALNGTSDLRIARAFKVVKNFTYTYTTAGHSNYLVSLSSRQATGSSLALPQFAYKPSTSLKAVANGLALLSQLRK